ncbi:MAG: MoaD/ThiS family protein [Acidiferrobacterales bacterium]
MHMKIQVRSAGVLAKYLPADSIKNVAELEVAEAATPLDVIKQLGMPIGGQYFVALNGELVTKDERERRTLAANDKLSIMPPLKGG